MTKTADARIVPVFRYQHAEAALTWLSRAYGFATHEVFKGESDTVAHAETRFGPSAIAISSAGAAAASNPWSAVRYGLYVCLGDVDGLAARAASEDAVVAQPLRDMDYGARETSLRDSEQHLWSFGSYPMGDPGGPPTLFAGLHYGDGRKAIDFLQRAFGFGRGLTVDGERGEIDHAELWLGRDAVMVSASPKGSGFWGEHTQCTYGYAPDVEAHHARAQAAGATILQPPHDTPYGARTYYSLDVEGFLWSFGTYRPEKPGTGTGR